MDMGRMPKGLIFAMNMMGSFNYNDDLSSRFEVFKYYDLFKKEMHNGYFEKLLEKYILNSNHHVQVVINPSKTLGAEKKRKMDELMKSIKENMSEEEIEETIKQTQDLLVYQNHVDTKEELATLPTLDIKDIPTSVNYLPSKETKYIEGKVVVILGIEVYNDTD
jgi:Zn-dependent M16 (insulinase) family peptidase